MRTPSAIVVIFLTFLLSCGSPHHNGVGGTGNIAVNGDDESGIGGTGKPVPNSGVGGTGKQLAGLGGTGKKSSDGMGGTGHKGSGLGGTGQIADSGLGGTGIIGEVTGFGSIFVNGIEVEIVDSSEIRTDNKVNDGIDPGIGDIVEILAHRVGDETHAKKLNIRHEVVGPVSSVNIKQRRFTIIGQDIKLDNPQLKLPKTGEMIAVSGLRDHRGVIHATRVTKSKSKSIWLIDRIANNKSNTLKLGRSIIHSEQANYYRIGDVIRVQANYKNGKLYAKQIYSNKAFGNQVNHMILQGFIQEGNRNNYRISNVQFSTRSVRDRSTLKQNRGRWARIEVRRNQVGLWEVEQIINDSNLRRGSTASRQMYNRGSGHSTNIHDRFNSDMYFIQSPRSSGNNNNGTMNQSPNNPMTPGSGTGSGNGSGNGATGNGGNTGSSQPQIPKPPGGMGGSNNNGNNKPKRRMPMR